MYNLWLEKVKGGTGNCGPMTGFGNGNSSDFFGAVLMIFEYVSLRGFFF